MTSTIYTLPPRRALPPAATAACDGAAPWDAFYALHADRFFKDRHWLVREFAELEHAVTLAEVGCGVGNAALPLARSGPPGRVVFASDCAATAIDMLLTRRHPEVESGRLVPYVADAAVPGSLVGRGRAPPGRVDGATLIFALSAMAPAQQAVAVPNVAELLKPGGFVAFRDYAAGDAAGTRLAARKTPRALDGGDAAAAATADADTATPQFLARGDGTRAYFFRVEEVRSLFENAGFITDRAHTVTITKTNRKTGEVMPRVWVQAVFRWAGVEAGAATTPATAPATPARFPRPYVAEWERDTAPGPSDDEEDCVPVPTSLFAAPHPALEAATLDLPPPLGRVTLRCAPGELRSTLAHTGLLTWPAAPAFARTLCSSAGERLLAGADVLEVGAGASPAVALAATAHGARRVVATDGSPVAAAALSDNVALNAHAVVVERVRVRLLEWGDGDAARALASDHTRSGRGFSIVLGADVLYSAAACPLLFATLQAALAPGGVAILCHQTRRVSNGDAVAAAEAVGLSRCAPPSELAAAAAAHGIGDDCLLRLLCFERR